MGQRSLPGPIALSIADGVGRIRLQRPGIGNAIDLASARELRAAVTECASRPDVRAIVLMGEGRNFCVGGDLKSFSSQADLPGHLRSVAEQLAAAILLLAEGRAP